MSLFKVIYEVDQLALAEITLTMAASANVYEEEMEEEEEEVQMKFFCCNFWARSIPLSLYDQLTLSKMELGEKEESSESKSFKSDTDQKRDTPRYEQTCTPEIQLIGRTTIL